MIIAFAGHSLIPSNRSLEEKVKELIYQIAKGEDNITCYVGGYGDFDAICARACRDIKQFGLNIEVVYVSPYLRSSEMEKIKEMQRSRLCDSSLYPPIENVPLKYAISKRNEWVMCNADLIIAYVKHNYGGAYNSLRIAKRKNKKIINLYE